MAALMVALDTKQVLRSAYKLKKAYAMMDDFKAGKTKFTPQHFIAEQKIIKAKSKKVYKERTNSFGLNKSLKYYRKKYGQLGVTETAKHFFESNTFLNKLTFDRLLFNNYAKTQKEIPDSLNNLSYDNKNYLKYVKETFNKFVYSWK